MRDQLQALQDRVLAAIEQASELEELQKFRIKYLGKRVS